MLENTKSNQTVPEKKQIPYFLAGLLVGLLLLYAQLIFQGKIIFWRDVMHLYTVFQDFIRESLWAGDFPFWNPYLFTGTPQMAFVEPSLFYPGNWLFWIWDFAHALPWVLVGHQLLTGLGFYLLCRSWGLRPVSSSFAGYAWAFSGVMISMNNIYPLLYTVAWFPLVLWLAGRVYRRYVCHEWVALVAVYALHVLSGHLEIVYFGGIILGFYLLLGSGEQPESRWRASVRVGMALILGVAISALQLLPTFELLSQSTRQAGTGAMESQFWSLHPGSLLSFVIPDVIGNLFSGSNLSIFLGEKEFGRSLLILSVYIGVSTAFLGVAALFLYRRQRQQVMVLFWVWVAVLTVLLALGHYLPVYGWFHQWMPGFHFFRYPVKFAIFTSFALIAMAAYGLDGLLALEQPRRVWHGWVAGLVLVSWAIGISLWFWQEPLLQSGWPTIEWAYGESIPAQFRPVLQSLLVHVGKQWSIAGALLLAVWLCLILYWYIPQRKNMACGVLLVLTSLDLISSGLNTLWVTDPEFLTQPSPVVQQFKKLQLDQKPEARFIKSKQKNDIPQAFYQHYIMTRPHVGHFMLSALLMKDNLSLRYRFQNAYAHSPARTFRVDKMYAVYDSALESPYPEFRHLVETVLAARYIHNMQQPSAPVSQYFRRHPKLYRLVEQQPQLFSEIWENKTWQSRVHFKNQAFVVPDEDSAFQTLMHAREYHFDPLKHVILQRDQAYEQALKDVPPVAAPQKKFTAPQIVATSNNTVQLRFTTNHSGYLVLADQYYPGWQAWDNGKSVPILQANFMQRAIRVGPGNHEIRFAYQPRSFYLGLAISVLAVLVCLGILIKAYGKKTTPFSDPTTPTALA